ncbi:hypothetical protein CEUSTIGMA_g1825.t1 [Chlamydomonas eustigma]|uniref:Phosphatidylglycerol lysyltransferase C-terminal domain-containing protein n=1 Tax=Chlamydomonas eustigma TaxID=1157962 RepID=A0A250WU87_9CHLO|nr:hypothetical protein CEUSTIGMA_g1825.t1 [Chlamydomonas eustigma]|eukprot:GAX74377.1 hypothetical protein CEUSTIGMA_g1825.t1 [Chlamydomonas eustigma]
MTAPAVGEQAPAATAAENMGAVVISKGLLLHYMRLFGSSCMAFSALQDGMKNFTHPGCPGFLAFSRLPYLPVMHVVLSDPIAPQQCWKQMTEAFLAEYGKNCMFVQVSELYCQVLSGLGFFVNAFGGETEINTATFSYSGHAKRSLRQPIERARKAGVQVVETPLHKQAPYRQDEGAASCCQDKGNSAAFCCQKTKGAASSACCSTAAVAAAAEVQGGGCSTCTGPASPASAASPGTTAAAPAHLAHSPVLIIGPLAATSLLGTATQISSCISRRPSTATVATGTCARSASTLLPSSVLAGWLCFKKQLAAAHVQEQHHESSFIGIKCRFKACQGGLDRKPAGHNGVSSTLIVDDSSPGSLFTPRASSTTLNPTTTRAFAVRLQMEDSQEGHHNGDCKECPGMAAAGRGRYHSGCNESPGMGRGYQGGNKESPGIASATFAVDAATCKNATIMGHAGGSGDKQQLSDSTLPALTSSAPVVMHGEYSTLPALTSSAPVVMHGEYSTLPALTSSAPVVMHGEYSTLPALTSSAPVVMHYGEYSTLPALTSSAPVVMHGEYSTLPAVQWSTVDLVCEGSSKGSKGYKHTRPSFLSSRESLLLKKQLPSSSRQQTSPLLRNHNLLLLSHYGPPAFLEQKRSSGGAASSRSSVLSVVADNNVANASHVDVINGLLSSSPQSPLQADCCPLSSSINAYHYRQLQQPTAVTTVTAADNISSYATNATITATDCSSLRGKADNVAIMGSSLLNRSRQQLDSPLHSSYSSGASRPPCSILSHKSNVTAASLLSSARGKVNYEAETATSSSSSSPPLLQRKYEPFKNIIDDTSRIQLDKTALGVMIKPELLLQLQQVSEEWLSRRSASARTAWFLNSQPSFTQELPGVRLFVAYFHQTTCSAAAKQQRQLHIVKEQGAAHSDVFKQAVPAVPATSSGAGSRTHHHGRSDNYNNLQTATSGSTAEGRCVIGFAILDPMYMHGKVCGYYANVIRTSNKAPPGTAGLLIQEVIQALSREGVATLSLGLSPLHCLEEVGSSLNSLNPNSCQLKSCPKMHEALKWTYLRCNNFYPYRHISSAKAKYGGGSLIRKQQSHNVDSVRTATCNYFLSQGNYHQDPHGHDNDSSRSCNNESQCTKQGLRKQDCDMPHYGHDDSSRSCNNESLCTKEGLRNQDCDMPNYGHDYVVMDEGGPGGNSSNTASCGSIHAYCHHCNSEAQTAATGRPTAKAVTGSCICHDAEETTLTYHHMEYPDSRNVRWRPKYMAHNISVPRYDMCRFGLMCGLHNGLLSSSLWFTKVLVADSIGDAARTVIERISAGMSRTKGRTRAADC